MRTTIGAVALAAAITTGASSMANAAAVPAGSTAVTSGATLLSATAREHTLPAWPILRQGQNSSWPKVTVRSLQYLLNAHGARLTVDGAFGPLTRKAVIAFQRARHLTASGVVHAGTWLALIITVRGGSTGQAVRAVQDQINFRHITGRPLDVDGIFGPKTKAAVVTFQYGMIVEGISNVPVNGVVGSQTWQALVGNLLIF